MAIGVGEITKVTTNGPYFYTWKADNTQTNDDTVVTGKTVSQAYSDISSLIAAMPGTVQSVRIIANSV